MLAVQSPDVPPPGSADPNPRNDRMSTIRWSGTLLALRICRIYSNGPACPVQAVGLVVFDHGEELHGHQHVDYVLPLTVDSVFLCGRVNQTTSLRAVRLPSRTTLADNQVFDYVNGKTQIRTLQVYLHHGLLIYTSTLLGELGNLGERQHPVLLNFRGFVGGLSPVVGQRQRDQHVNDGD